MFTSHVRSKDDGRVGLIQRTAPKKRRNKEKLKTRTSAIMSGHFSGMGIWLSESNNLHYYFTHFFHAESSLIRFEVAVYL